MTLPTSSSKLTDWQPLSRTELLWFGLFFAFVTLIPAAVFWQTLPCSDDTLPHFYRTVQLHVNLQQGAPFLQWGSDMLRGYGYTIFLFYAPLTYWLLEVIHLLGFDFGPAMQIAFVAVLWLAGWGVYVLARYFVAPLGAFVAGLAYLFAPYVLYDAIQRGALPETLALALTPWALAVALRALDKPRPATITLAAALFVALILAHNVVPIFALGIISLFALGSWQGSLRHNPAALIPALKTMVLMLGFALGLTLFFWLPGLVELQHTQSRLPDPPLRDWPRYEQHIVPVHDLAVLPDDPADPNLLNPPIPRTLGIAQMFFGLAGMVALFWYKQLAPNLSNAPVINRQLVLLALVTLTAVFFSSQWSMWGWQHLPLLNFIQMPTRFLGLASLGLALFSGVFIDQLTRWLPGKWTTAVILIVAALAVSVSGWAWLYPLYCPVPVQPTRTDLAQATTWSRWYAEAQAELLPRWVEAMPPEDGLISQYAAEGVVNRLMLPETAVLQDWQSGQASDTYQLFLTEPASLVYQAFYFPGWQVEVNDRSLPITPTSPEGFIQVDVPAGEHTLAVHFSATPLRVLTLFLSGLTAVILITWVWRSKKESTPSGSANLPTSYKYALPLIFITILILILVKSVLFDRVSTPLRADRLQNGQLVGVSIPTGIQFDKEIIHLGYEGVETIKASENFVITQYWTPQREIGVPYGFTLQVVDDDGQIWHEFPGRPFNYTNFPVTELWQPGQYVRDAYDVKLLPGTPPGTYWLETAVFRRDTDLSLLPSSSGVGSSPDRARLGSIQVTPGKWHLTADTAQVDTYEPTPLTAVPGLTLLGWTAPDVVWRPGQEAEVDLLWTAAEVDITETLVPVIWLADANGEEAAQTAVTVGGNYPITAWPDGAVVRDQVRWRLPPGLESGEYTVWLSVGEQVIELGQWQIDAPPRTFEQPKVDITSDFQVDFGKLVGYSLTVVSAGSVHAVSPGQSLELELVWQATGETPTSYRVFVHLLDENGRLVAQSDAIPDNWTRPTTGWLPGEYIRDRHTLTLPADAAPGDYTLVVGFYETVTGSRLGEAEIGRVIVSGE